ncbi:MAG: ATP-binding protein [Gammaproteobacteria bacterium]|nr:ATP-binding protein [Gammaproteobacteria bacterium]
MIILELRFVSRPGRLKRMREAMAEVLGGQGCGDKDTRLLVLAVNEACMNIIQHGYHGDPEGEIILEILNNNGELEFRLRDYAEVIEPDTLKPRPHGELKPGGLGMYFIRQIMDEFTFEVPEPGVGNLLIMKKRLKPESGVSVNAN